MVITALELLYIALAIAVISLTIPLSMILWRVYGMLDKVEKIVNFVDRMVGYGAELERIPLAILSRFFGR